MSFNAKDMTQGGQIASMRNRTSSAAGGHDLHAGQYRYR